MAQNIEYTIDMVTEQDFDDVIKLLRKTFYIDEPLNKAVGFCDDGVTSHPFLEGYYKSVLAKGYSIKAVDKDGNIIGVLVNGVVNVRKGINFLEVAEKCPDPKLQKILYIVSRRADGAKLWEKYPEDEKLVDIDIAATDHSWQNKGIMKKLVERTEKITKERGMRLLRLDCSSAYSAKTAESLGFTCVYSAKYTEIKKDGKPLIVPEAPHLYDRVYIKELNK